MKEGEVRQRDKGERIGRESVKSRREGVKRERGDEDPF